MCAGGMAAGGTQITRGAAIANGNNINARHRASHQKKIIEA